MKKRPPFRKFVELWLEKMTEIVASIIFLLKLVGAAVAVLLVLLVLPLIIVAYLIVWFRYAVLNDEDDPDYRDPTHLGSRDESNQDVT